VISSEEDNLSKLLRKEHRRNEKRKRHEVIKNSETEGTA